MGARRRRSSWARRTSTRRSGRFGVVEVDGFWIDRHPVTVAEFREFVSTTGYRTVAERPLEPADFPGVDPAKLVPGSLVFHMTSGPVDLDDYFAWWDYVPDACWATTGGAGLVSGRARAAPRRARRLRGRRRLRRVGRQGSCPPRPSGSTPPAAGSTARPSPGATSDVQDDRAARQHLARRVPVAERRARRLRGHLARRQLPAERLRALRHGRQRLGVDHRLLRGMRETSPPCCAPQSAVGESVPRRVIKGGSHLCAPNYCLRYRPAARQSETVDTSTSHIGFRCVVRP